MKELKPCPFCGGEAEIVKQVDTPFYGVGCKDGWCIGAGTKHENYIGYDKAAKAWNTRTVKVDVTRFCEVSGL